MLSNKLIIRLSIVIGTLSWGLLLFFDIMAIPEFGYDQIPDYLKYILFNIYIITIFIYQKIRLEKNENISFLDLLWAAFYSGLLATVLALIFRISDLKLLDYLFLESTWFVNIVYDLLFAFVIIFLVTAFTAWKKLILYQKSKLLKKIWYIFEFALITSLFLIFINNNQINNFVFYVPYGLFVLFTLILSVNLKWVAYINFRQKWQSILLILLTLIYTVFLFTNLLKFSNHPLLILDIFHNVFIFSIFTFIAVYAVFSILVILFNLPTSSVFEQKLEEVINFQRLSQSIQLGKNEEYVHDVLLQSSTSTVLADSAWLEIYDEKKELKSLLKKDINDAQITAIKDAFTISKFKDSFEINSFRTVNKSKLEKSAKKLPFGSILIIPLHTLHNRIGVMVLLKDEKDGFSKEMIEMVNAFANQASISIDNFRLLAEALSTERYKEELKIAKRVQKSLLPDDLNYSDYYKISTFTMAADEIGGDYYDIYQISETQSAFIIGDVSGKGTSAAFNMAQLKGVFHSLVQLNLSSELFLHYANNALGRCLERSSFITVTFFIVDFEKRKIQMARAGHCPTLYYNSVANEVSFIQNKGLGLGILRNDDFKNFIEVVEYNYNPNDILLLYTDGITEARNKQNEEYGYDRLKQFLLSNHLFEPEGLNQKLIYDIYKFCDGVRLNDDYTTVLIKFNA